MQNDWQKNREYLKEYFEKMSELTTETVLFEYQNLEENFEQNEFVKSKKMRILQILRDRNEENLLPKTQKSPARKRR